MKKEEKIDYSEELGEDLVKYLKVYIDEVDKSLRSTSDKREAISLLSKKLSKDDLKEVEEPSEELTELFTDVTKKKEALKRLENSLNEEVEQFDMIAGVLRSLFDEVEKRIKNDDA